MEFMPYAIPCSISHPVTTPIAKVTMNFARVCPVYLAVEKWGKLEVADGVTVKREYLPVELFLSTLCVHPLIEQSILRAFVVQAL